MTHRPCSAGGTGRTTYGTTLIELVVTLAVLGIIASVATLAIRRQPAPADDLATAVLGARRAAAETGRTIRISRVEEGRPVEFVACPDGRVIADSGVGVAQLTGQAVRTPR